MSNPNCSHCGGMGITWPRMAPCGFCYTPDASKVLAAIAETNDKYFGDGELSACQQQAVSVLVRVAEIYLAELAAKV